MRGRWVFGSVALVALLGCSAAFYFWLNRNGSSLLVLPGVVEIQEVRLGSKIGGRVAKVEVAEGDIVQEKDVLVRFEAPELEAQSEQAQARLHAAEAELEKARNGPRVEEKEAARAAVEAAKARLDRMKAGWRDEEKRQARSEFDSAEADFKLAREEFDRVERLQRQSSASKAEYDSAKANRDRASARLAAARARNDMLLLGNRVEDIAEATAEHARALANYSLLQAGTRSEDLAGAEARVGEMRGRVRELQAQLEERTVRAPEKSIVEVVSVRKGDLTTPNQCVVRILRADDLWVKVYVPETDLGRVRLNQEVEVTVDAYRDRRFHGKIRQISGESEFTPRNIQSVDERRHQVFGIKVQVADPEGVFKSGMAAEVTIPLEP